MEKKDYIKQIEDLSAEQIAEGISLGKVTFDELKKTEEFDASKQKKVKSMTALALSSLAEASAPYGIEAFDDVLIPLWKLTTHTKDKSLGAYLKAIGFIIPLMDAKHSAKYTESVMPAIIQQFRTNE